MSITSNYHSHLGLWLHRLRSVKFNIQSESIERSQRVAIVTQILDSSPTLSHVVVAWKDFRHCSKTYSNLKHVHLVLDRLYPDFELKQHFNVRRLAQLAPNLCFLETSNENIMFNENLVKFVLKIIRRFNQLVYLILNRNSCYKSKEEKRKIFKDNLIAAGHGRLLDYNNIQIDFPRQDELCIWL
jgi:hypothetical protein